MILPLNSGPAQLVSIRFTMRMVGASRWRIPVIKRSKAAVEAVEKYIAMILFA